MALGPGPEKATYEPPFGPNPGDNAEITENTQHDLNQPEHWVQAHARRYMEAWYGPSVGFRAPETFDNVLEQWIMAVSAGDRESAEKYMSQIEEMAKEIQR